MEVRTLKIIKNRAFAIILMFIIIICSIGFGSYRSLSELSNNTTNVFYNGVNNDGKSIQSNLDQRISTSNSMVNLAKKYFPASDEAIVNVANAMNDLSQADSPSTKCAANKILTQQTDDLYYKLNTSKSLNSTDVKNLTKLSDQLSVSNDLINKDGYNNVAIDYNNTIAVFPANVISSTLGIKPAELFR